MIFGSYEWHLHHNAELAKRNAQICMINFKQSGKDFYLNDAIFYTTSALKLKKTIKAQKCTN